MRSWLPLYQWAGGNLDGTLDGGLLTMLGPTKKAAGLENADYYININQPLFKKHLIMMYHDMMKCTIRVVPFQKYILSLYKTLWSC